MILSPRRAFGCFLLILLAGCSGSQIPVDPQKDPLGLIPVQVPAETLTADPVEAAHYLWLFNLIYIDPADSDDVHFEVVPVRQVAAHWNVLGWLEQSPCASCFELIQLTPSGSGTLLAEIQIRHPFGNPNLTGFDVRGIAMFNGSELFPESGLTYSDRLAYDGVVVNPDGFTTLYNSTTIGQGPNGLQGYLKGKLATANAPDALLNAYKRFVSKDPANTRNAFYAGEALTVTYEIDMPDEPPFVMGYAVDASWAPPTIKPVIDPITDFPPEANCPEPWTIDVSQNPIGQGLTNHGGSTELTIDVFDWQGKTTLLPPRVECPEIFNGFETATWVEDGTGYTRYEVTIQNDNFAVYQTYNCLVIVEDTENAGSPDWLDLTAYKIFQLEVVEGADEPPVPLVTWHPDTPVICESIDFGDNGSFDPDGGPIVLYEWDWDNDGIFDEAGEDVSHAWDTIDNYTFGFRVTDDEGSMGITHPFFDVKNGPPLPSASADKLAAYIGESITFDGSASVDTDCDGQSITEYGWDWDGDYNIDDYGVTQSHSFSSSGDHYVGLRVQDNESEAVWTDLPLIIDVNNGWARTWGDDGWDETNSVACDSAGNVYAFGTFEDTVDFDPGSGVNEITSNGSYDIFLSKFSPEGNLSWAISWGSDSIDAAIGIAISGTDDIFLTGYFSDTMDLDPDPDGTVNRTSNGSSDIFIIRLNSSGEYLWGGVMGGSEADNGIDVAVDDSTNSYYLIGVFSDTADFDPSFSMENYLDSNGGWDCFLSKFKLSTNTYYWTKTWGGINDDWAHGVDVDGSSVVYVCGAFKDTVDFNPDGGVEERTSAGQKDAFLSSFSSLGSFSWVSSWGGFSDDIAHSVAASPVASEAWVAGEVSGTVDFNPWAPVDNHDGGAFLCNYGGDGTYNFARTWGGPGHEIAKSISYLPGSDLLAVAGSFSETADFDPGPESSEHTSNGLRDVFVSTFSGDGEFFWADTWGGAGADDGFCVTFRDVLPSPIYVGGWFKEVVDFDPQEGEDNHSSNGGFDAFLSRLPSDGVW